jgi:hypothetical protein
MRPLLSVLLALVIGALVTSSCAKKDDGVVAIGSEAARLTPRLGIDYVDMTAEDCFSGITVTSVKAGPMGLDIVSLQKRYRELWSLPPVVEKSDTHYVFLAPNNGPAYRVTLKRDDAAVLRKAKNEGDLTSVGRFTENAFDVSEYASWDINANIPDEVFFTELVCGLRLLKGDISVKPVQFDKPEKQ